MSTYLNAKENIFPDYRQEDCPPLLVKYLLHLRVSRNLAPTSINAYFTDIHLFLRFISRMKGYAPKTTPLEDVKVKTMTNYQIAAVSGEDIFAFLYYLVEDRNNTPRTRLRKCAAISGFYDYLKKIEYMISENPFESVEKQTGRSSKLPVYLTEEQAKALLEAVEGENKERNYCIIVLFLTCGMRVSELVGIDVDDVTETSIKLYGKGRKERYAYLNSLALKALSEWMEERDRIPGADEEKALFITSRRKQRITVRAVQYVVETCAKKAGIAIDCTPHKLRHTTGTLMRQNGVDLRVIQELLGHSDLSTTQIYTHVEQRELQQAVEGSPFNLVQENPAEENHSQENPVQENLGQENTGGNI